MFSLWVGVWWQKSDDNAYGTPDADVDASILSQTLMTKTKSRPLIHSPTALVGQEVPTK